MPSKRLYLLASDMKALAKEIAKEVGNYTDNILNVPEVADMLRISEEAVRKMSVRGQIPSHRRGNRLIFSEQEIKNFLLEKTLG